MVGFLRKNYWISLGLLAILIRVLFSIFPSLYALLYRDTLFPAIRFIFDHTFGLLPFAAAYLVVPITLLWVMYVVIRWIKLIFWKRQIKKAILSLVNFSMGITFLFLFIWGFHYARPAIEDTIGLQVIEGLTINELKDEITEIHDICIQLRAQFHSTHHQAIPDSIYSDQMVDQIRTLEQQILQGLSIPVNGYVPARFIRPDGLLLRFNASGIYIPITGEAHIENTTNVCKSIYYRS